MSGRTAAPLRLLQRASTAAASQPGRLAATRSMTRSYASQREPGPGREPTVAKIPPAPPSHPFGRPDVDPMTGESAPGRSDIDPSLLVVTENPSPGQPLPASQLQFGRTFTPHMLCVPWNVETGWGKPEIKPYGPFNLDPSATVYHYAPCLFEGMKAYKSADGTVRLFRPDKNMERMVRSAARLAFPTFTGDNLIELIKRLVAMDAHWIPTEPGHSLYIRPTMIGTQAGLGVGPSSDILLFVICSPVGPYYKTGFKPVSLLASTEHVRAWPGGTGGYKLGSNYAGGVVPQQQAAALGYQQILWLYGPDHELTEVGTMNLFTVFEDANGDLELVTPPLGDTILPGVTRDSILELARGHADGSAPLPELAHLKGRLRVSERKVTMPEVEAAAKDGRLREIFGSGTAAIVSSVDSIGYDGRQIPVPVGEDGLGDVTRAMLRGIVGRQLGEIESSWSVLVK